MEACWSRFTAAEGGARLAATASLKNTLAVEHSSFIAVRLLYEKAYQIRGSLFDDRKRSVYITRATRVPVVGFELKILTDLSVIEATEYSDVYDWCAELDSKEVIVCTAAILKQILAEELLSMVNINVLVIDSCHMVYEDDNLKYIMQQYKQCNNNNRPIILALTYPLFSLNTKDNEKLKDISQLKTCSESKETSIIKKNEKELIEDDENPDVEAIENTQVIKQSHTTTINSKSFEEHSQFKRIIEIDANGEIEDLKYQEILERDSKSQVEDLKCTEIAAKNSCTDFKCQEISSKNYHSGDLNSKLIGNASSSVKELQCNDNTVSETNVHDKITQIALTDDKVNEEDITADANVIEDKFEQLALNDGKINDEDIQCKNKTENTDKIDDKFIQIALIEDKDNEKESLVTEKNDENFKVDNNQIHIGVYENLDDFDMYEKLEWKIEELENELCCQMDLAEDIDGGKRLSTSITKPRELIIEYSGRPTNDKLSQEYLDLEKYMRDTIADAMIFINDHRHDPSEIYGEELFEEFMNIPDPTIEPKHILNQFLYVLDQLGPYAADKAAFSLLTKLEKLKIKVPYERHFLLLCLCTTVFVKIRCYADEVFNKYSTDWERIQTFCTPKVLRFAEILDTFQPPETKADDDNSTNHTNDNDISIKDNIDSDVNVSHDIIENEIDENRRIFETNNFYDGSSISCTTNVDSKSVIVETSGNLNVNIDINGTDIKLGKMCDDAIVVDTNNVDDASLSGDICGNDIKMNTVTKETLAVDASKMLDELDKCDFNTLGDKIQDRVNIYEANLKDIDDITDDLYINQNCINLDINNEDNKNIVIKIKDTQGISDDIEKVELCDVKDNENGNIEVTNKQEPQKLLGARRRTGHRVRGSRGRGVASARTQQLQLNPDALCAVVYLRDPLLAKIMFMLVVDMSRCNPRLSYLCAQYCATEQPADPGTEPKECQRQGKKQEEVLKKFRMHECNLLLATSELEEGIDLPRCNLVLRWDLPPSYRSYGACRSRARALRSAAALLCTHDAATTDLLLHNLATYRELDQMISRKCGCGMQDEPPQSEEDHADTFTAIIKPYTPNDAVNPFKNSSDISKTSQDISKINTDTENIDQMLLNGINLDIESESEIKVNTNNLGLCNTDNEVKCIVNIKDTEEDNKLEIAKHDYNKFNNLYIYDKRTDNSLHYNENNDNSELSTCITNSVLDNTEQNKETVDNNIFNENIPKTHTDKIVKENPVNKTGISERDIRDIKTNVNCYNKCDAKSSDNECASDIINVSRCYIVSKSHSETKGDSKENVNDNENIASVDLSNAIALINRYCGKLPSDTFTRLTPQWWLEEVQLPVSGSAETRTAYICTLRLPLNCPVKYNIVGHPMPTKVLARRMVALQACRILHKSGELDDQLMPIGKENFKAAEMEGAGVGSGDSEAGESARPGTTKRRQYYYKRTALAFTDCQPVEDTSDSETDPPGDRPRPEARPKLKDTKQGVKRNMLYAIVSRLWCALPERYNTRGRRLHAPQSARQAIGLLMARAEPDNLQIPAFPVYTRSGEVRVSVEHVPDADVRLSPRRGRLVRRFMRFVFSEVLRVRRRGMKLQSEGSTHNNYYIVPTVKSTREDGTTKIDIDWPFLELIYQHTEEKKQLELEMPIPWNQDGKDEGGNAEIEKETKFRRRDGRVKKMENPLLKPGETFVFDAEKYREAVVTPWYRNQDQPQFFLVAEICWNLTPDSAFPSTTHGSFRDYYTNKYGVTLTQKDQPLLDVDHTSARLNLLTPRYVNRKGVALPVSSERTRRAKRDRLDQKQILVPELCRVHPFAAPLWFATVALPCVLYRINALLIADEIRRAVAIDVGLGIPKITEETRPGFHWPPLDFGWSLADVLSADSEKNEKKKEEDETKMNQNEIEGKEEKEIERDTTEEKKAKTVNDILQEKEGADNCFEIGTWSNDMASSIPLNDDYDEYMEPLPPNLTFCTSASGGTDWCQPIEKPKCQFNPSRSYSMADSDCSFISSDLDSDDSDLEFDGSEDEDTDTSGFYSSKNANAAMGVRIEYKTAHEAEAFDLERNKKVNPAPLPDPEDDLEDRAAYERLIRTGKSPEARTQQFQDAVTRHKVDIIANGHLITKDQKITQILPETKGQKRSYQQKTLADQDLTELFPYGHEGLTFINGKVDVASVERNKRELLHKFKTSLPNDVIKSLNCFSMVDIDIDSPEYVNERVSNVGFDKKDKYEDLNDEVEKETKRGSGFEFDYQPALRGHPGPTPSLILQALTMSNANDGMNLERLETIGDSFLKFAITAYLYCAHPTVHEGKLSHMRSKQVSNLNLYRLGRSKRLGARMIASKFEPHDNWLPPCHKPPHTQHHAYATDSKELGSNGDAQLDASGCFIPYNLITQHSIPDKSIADCVEALIGAYLLECGPRGALLFMAWLGIRVLPAHRIPLPPDHPAIRQLPTAQKPSPAPSPRRHRTSSSSSSSTSSSSCSSDEEQQSQQDHYPESDWSWPGRPVGSLRPFKDENGQWVLLVFGELKAPPSPLLRYIEDPEGELERMLSGYEELERTLQYRFKDRSLLLQALTHASHQSNRLTDCYQRLEFLGDAILDYLITRHLYEDPRRHSPGALTDLRSALVNNTIFATLAARHGFHKYFRHMSPGLNEVLTKYVKIQEENGHSISEEHYLIQEDEMEQAEDVEVPKALGDLFESVAGAIFLDSGMSLDAVWKSYVNLMGAELEAFSAAAPKSPVRELLEAEPDTAKFGKPERLADGRRVRVCVEVFGRGAFKGVGRNYRIAKGTAARCALRHLRATRTR